MTHNILQAAESIYSNSPTEREALAHKYVAGVQLATVTTPGGSVTDILSATHLGIGGFHRFEAVLNVTAAATEVGDTLDVFVDCSPDGGTTWINIVHFTQVLGNGGPLTFLAISDDTTGMEENVTSALAAGAVPRPLLGNAIRVRHTAVDANANANAVFAFTVTGSFKH